MSCYLVTATSGLELARGQLVDPGAGTVFDSPSACRAAMGRYRGTEPLAFAPAPGSMLKPPGRPKSMHKGTTRRIYIDDASWQRAIDLGAGNASDGIRKALSAS